MSKTTSAAGIALIKRFEGCRLVAYKAVPTEQYWTIGYGHYGPDVDKNMTITQAQANAYLKKDLAKFEKAVSDYVKIALNQNQFDALVSFCYNCGAGALSGSTLLKKLNTKDYAGAAKEFLSWNKSSGKVLAGLITRRAAEMALFLKEVDTMPKAPITPESSKEDVKWLQERLNKALGCNLTTDGKYGMKTRIAVLQFAVSKGWKSYDHATGYKVGAGTVKALK